MSEYQFYEFRSIDKPLTKEEQNNIKDWSSRAKVNSSSAIFTYSYKDFSQDEQRVIQKYFDAMFYIANWGAKRIVFKFPTELINIEEIKKYCNDEEFSIIINNKKNILIDFNFSEDEPEDDFIEGEGYLSSIISLRDDIMNGDYRCLYLAWLKTSNNAINSEIPIPNGLNKLNSSLQSFIELLNIDKKLLSVAIKSSKDNDNNTDYQFENLIKGLTDEEKNSFLLRLVKGETLLTQKLIKRLKTNL
ncbi:MAG: hypothetical protein AABZ74_17590 [Cyanobacteriota bacterium]